MVSVVALLCAATIGQSDCSVDNAIDVIRLPDATSELNCMEGAMTTLASLAIQPTNGDIGRSGALGQKSSRSKSRDDITPKIVL